MLKPNTFRKHVLRGVKASCDYAEFFSNKRSGHSKFFCSNPGTSETRLGGKIAIITGGASGIGEATARLFVAHGAKVVVADIQDQLGRKVAEDLGPSADFRHCDVSQEEDISTLVDYAMSKHGSLDIMFNNAGVASGGIGPIASLDMQDFDKVMGVNVRGVVMGVKHAARVMVPQKKGCILCTGSINGIVATGVNHVYAISKHAVPGIVKTAANELGKYGIRVNCISPFMIVTPLVSNSMTGLLPHITTDFLEKMQDENSELKGVKLEVEDIARAALFLGSEDGRFVSGHNLVVDGGFTISKHFSVNS
eukprot:c23124_g1_i1 orf=391-1314(-)